MSIAATSQRRPLLVIRASVFWLGMALSTLIMAPLCVLIAPLPFNARYRFTTLWSHFNLRWLKLTCALDYRVHGREHLPARNAIVLAKHQSAWETLALPCVLPPLVWVLKRDLLYIPFFGWGLALLEPIAIDRKSAKAGRQVINQGTKRLHSGRWVVLFPQGTRTAPGEIKPYSVSGALLALRSGYPIVPIAHNAGSYWPRRGFIKYPGTIDLVIGPAIFAHGRRAADINAEVEQWIENTMRAMDYPDH